MAKEKRKARRPMPPSDPTAPMADADEPGAVDEQAAANAAQRAAVRRTTTGIVLFCILVGLATAAIMIAGAGGSGQ